MLEPIRTPECRTPDKIRYGTRTHAKEAAKSVQLQIGMPLYIYRCPCGFWHLTKRRIGYADASHDGLLGIGQALGMDDQMFQAVVMRELYGELSADDAEILGHPDVRTRWVEALDALRRRTDRSLRKYRNAQTAEELEYRAQLQQQIRMIGKRQGEI